MHHAVDGLEEKPVVVAIDHGGAPCLHELSPFRTGDSEGRLHELLDWMERPLMLGSSAAPPWLPSHSVPAFESDNPIQDIAPNRRMVRKTTEGHDFMKVRLMGFAVVPGKGFSLEDFEGRIQSLADGQEKWGGHARMVRAKKKGEYFEGLVITIKDQKSFCVLKKEQQTKAYAVTVKQLEAGEQLMDFNHFVWSRVTGRGIYQHYHQSMGLNMFGGYLQDQYALMKTERIRKEIADAGGEDKVSANAVAKLKRQFKGGLTFQQIATEETLSQLVNDLAALRRVNLELTVIQKDEGSMFNAVRKYVKKRDVSLLIDPTWRESSGVKGAVLSLIKNHEIKRGTIEGLDAEERFKKLRLGENYDFYGEYDFEEVTKGMAINLLEWHKSPVLKLIHEALSDHEDTFLTPGED